MPVLGICTPQHNEISQDLVGHFERGLVKKGCMKSFIGKKRRDITRNLEANTVPADGLAPLGARPSAGSMMAKFRATTYTWLP